MELFSLLLETQLLQATRLQAGVEYALFNDFDRDMEDFDSLSWALQLATESGLFGLPDPGVGRLCSRAQGVCRGRGRNDDRDLCHAIRRLTIVGLYSANHLTTFCSLVFRLQLSFLSSTYPKEVAMKRLFTCGPNDNRPTGLCASRRGPRAPGRASFSPCSSPTHMCRTSTDLTTIGRLCRSKCTPFPARCSFRCMALLATTCRAAAWIRLRCRFATFWVGTIRATSCT